MAYSSSTDNLIQKLKGWTQRDKEVNFKIVILGADGVGKTALIVRCLVDRFYNNYVSEPEETYQYTVMIGTKKVVFDIIDTKGKNNAVISYADAILLVFSITDLASFEHIKEELMKVKGLLGLRRAAPIILIANKMDKSRHREVKKEDYENLAKQHELKYFEISAAIPTLTLDKVFEEVYQQAYASKKRRPRSCVITPIRNPPLERRLSRSLQEGDFISIVHPRPRSTTSATLLSSQTELTESTCDLTF